LTALGRVVNTLIENRERMKVSSRFLTLQVFDAVAIVSEGITLFPGVLAFDLAETTGSLPRVQIDTLAYGERCRFGVAAFRRPL